MWYVNGSSGQYSCETKCEDGYFFDETSAWCQWWHLSVGAIAGAAVGSIVGLVLIYAIVSYCCKNKNCCRNKNNDNVNVNGNLMDPGSTERVLSPIIDQSLPCAICLGDKCNKTLTCGHSFHIECITAWTRRNMHCPVCRAPSYAWLE